MLHCVERVVPHLRQRHSARSTLDRRGGAQLTMDSWHATYMTRAMHCDRQLHAARPHERRAEAASGCIDRSAPRLQRSWHTHARARAASVGVGLGGDAVRTRCRTALRARIGSATPAGMRGGSPRLRTATRRTRVHRRANVSGTLPVPARRSPARLCRVLLKRGPTQAHSAAPLQLLVAQARCCDSTASAPSGYDAS
jgi:hypothetical protein